MDEIMDLINHLNMNFNIQNLENCQTLLYLIYNNTFKINDPQVQSGINQILSKIETQLLDSNLLEIHDNHGCCDEIPCGMDDPFRFTPRFDEGPQNDMGPDYNFFSKFVSNTLLSQIFCCN